MAQAAFRTDNDWTPDWERVITHDDTPDYLKRHPGVKNGIHSDVEEARRIVPGATDIVVPGALIGCFLDEAVCEKYPGMMAGRCKFDFRDALQPGDTLGFFFGKEKHIDRTDGIECFAVRVEARRNRNGLVTLTCIFDLFLSPHGQQLPS